MTAGRPHLLPPDPDVPADLLSRVKDDHDRFAREGLPANLEAYLLDAYALEVTGSYAGLPVRNLWGKASGQLTLNLAQLEEAAAEGLGFAVLKTVIAQDSAGRQSMSAWALKESRMVAEPITSPLTGARGWTITWRGRGWWQSFDDYLALVRDGVALGRTRGMPVIPSVKHHLPGPGQNEWQIGEYGATTRALLEAWSQGGGSLPMPLERQGQARGEICRQPLEISATGDVSSGRIAIEYALRGCTSMQIHTLFQLPAEIFAMRRGSKIERAIHRLYFDPADGFIVWAAHAARRLGLIAPGSGTIRFRDLARRGAESALEVRDLDPETT